MLHFSGVNAREANLYSHETLRQCSAGSRERTDITTYPQPYAGWGRGRPGWWGGPYWGDAVDVHQYQEGTLALDVFDTRSHRPVWHGWAKNELSDDDIERSAAPVQRAVAAVLAKFPPT